MAEIANRTGVSVSQVRRIVGKLDPTEKESRRKKQEEMAERINARSEPWPEKVKRWRSETGQSEATLFRVIKRIGERRAEGGPHA